MNAVVRYGLIVCMLCSLASMQAKGSIVGKVVDEQKQPILFASIYLENNPQIGTVSDDNGVFVLDSLDLHQTVIVSFIGYKTIEFQLKKYPADTLQITLLEQPILLQEASVGKEKKNVSKRRQKKNLLNDVYSQLLYDFPDKNHFYKVISDYAIYNNDKIAAFEEIEGNVIEMPGKGPKGRDSVQLKVNWAKRYRHPDTHQRLSGIEGQLRKNKNAERIQLVDSSAFVHRVLWGGDIKWMYKEFKGKVSKWEAYEKDSILLLTFHDSYNFLGILKIDLTINMVLDPYSYRIRKQSQSLLLEANIPFGYKLNADQLAILNTVIISSENLEKFRLKKLHADVKRNIMYNEVNNQVFVEEKNVISKIKMIDNKGRQLDFYQTALMKVISASISGVVPYTKEQLNEPHELIIQ